MLEFRSLVIAPAQHDDVDYVARRMRDQDRKEIFGCRFSDDVQSLINETIFADQSGLLPYHYAVQHRSHPRSCAILSLQMAGPGHGFVNMFATNDFSKIIRDITRFVRDVFVPDCIKAGLRRVELRTLASWTENRRWLEILGAEFECEIRGMGQEPYAQYAWTREG